MEDSEGMHGRNDRRRRIAKVGTRVGTSTGTSSGGSTVGESGEYERGREEGAGETAHSPLRHLPQLAHNSPRQKARRLAGQRWFVAARRHAG